MSMMTADSLIMMTVQYSETCHSVLEIHRRDPQCHEPDTQSFHIMWLQDNQDFRLARSHWLTRVEPSKFQWSQHRSPC